MGCGVSTEPLQPREQTSRPIISELEKHFNIFRERIVGLDLTLESNFGGEILVVYADWTASGRLYLPIEEKLLKGLGAFVGNTHTETTATGEAMTRAYKKAKEIFKKHVNASDGDVLIPSGSGMTSAVNKMQHILNLHALDFRQENTDENVPVVLVTHFEHHSNQTSWECTTAVVEIVPPDEFGMVSVENFEEAVKRHAFRKTKIASVSACSNVTGITSPYHEIAKLMHRNNGLCFVDFACSFPYINVDMHPDDERSLDAIFLSPHKMLGGPGSSGILIFNGNLYKHQTPLMPGGGTVNWTDPWGGHEFIEDIETREDGGTPGFLQMIKGSLAVQLKEEMGVQNIQLREQEIVQLVFSSLSENPNIIVLAGHCRERLPVFSLIIKNVHYNLCVALLNDKFGIQARGGCSCAGSYGHYLLGVSRRQSFDTVEKIRGGDLSVKPGWVRISFHPTNTNAEILYVCKSLKEIALQYTTLQENYTYNPQRNEFTHLKSNKFVEHKVESWFDQSCKKTESIAIKKPNRLVRVVPFDGVVPP